MCGGMVEMQPQSFSETESLEGPLFSRNEMNVLSDGQSVAPPPPPKISVSVQYFISIISGILFGILLNYLKVNDGVVSLITLPGALFLRALQCTVIPMMFFNIVCSVYEIFGSGSASSIGNRAIWFYTLTTVMATLEGIVIANIFSSLLVSKDSDDDDDGVKVSLACPEDEGVLTMTIDGTVLCIPHDDLKAYNVTSKSGLSLPPVSLCPHRAP
jgi:L-cystine uptake protein TcyP (sodium:dicarboxylate symporter family)